MINQFHAARLRLYKEAYDRELARRQEGMDRQSRAITIFTLIGGIIAFYSSNLPQISDSIWFIIFMVLVGVGLVLASIGFGLLVVTLWRGTTYTLLNTPHAIDEPYLPLIADGLITGENAEGYADQLDFNLLEQYRDFGTVNQLGNNLRDGNYNKILRWAICAVVALVLAAPFHLAVRQHEVKKPESVIITEPVRIMTNGDSQSSQGGGAPSGAKPAAPAPAAPAVPAPVGTGAPPPVAQVALPPGIQLKAGVPTGIAKVSLPGGIRLNEAFGRKEIQQNQQQAKPASVKPPAASDKSGRPS